MLSVWATNLREKTYADKLKGDVPTYANAEEWTKKAEDLAARFIKNFKKYENNEAGKALVAAGPQL